MSEGSQHSLCDVSYTFTVVDDEEDDTTEFSNELVSMPPTHKIVLESGVVLELSKEELNRAVCSPFKNFWSPDIPSCSTSLNIPNCDNEITLTLSNGVKFNLTEEKYRQYFSFKDSMVMDDDHKSSIIDTDSDEAESGDDDKKTSKSSTNKEKKKKQESDDKNKAEEKSNTEKEKSSKKKNKRKSQKKSDVNSSDSNSSVKAEPQKKKRRKSKKREPDNKPESDEVLQLF